MHLDELAGDEIQRQPVVAREIQVAHAGRQHAAADQPQREVDGQRGTPSGAPMRGAYNNAHDAFPRLHIQDLRKAYDNGVEALKGVSLSVQPGDFFALLGPNGAGKSTLIGVVSSLVNATSGSAEVFGIDVHDAALRGDAPDRPGAAGDELQLLRKAARHPVQLRRLLRRAARRGAGARRGGTEDRAGCGPRRT